MIVDTILLRYTALSGPAQDSDALSESTIVNTKATITTSRKRWPAKTQPCARTISAKTYRRTMACTRPGTITVVLCKGSLLPSERIVAGAGRTALEAGPRRAAPKRVTEPGTWTTEAPTSANQGTAALIDQIDTSRLWH